jgi:NAD(P)-dependent dehydrogenase (short-subunit alcohol dehydrogenase family)
MSEMLEYAGKRVVVTGAASGMGQATTALLGELGAKVIAIDIKPPTENVEAFLETDLREEAAIDATLERITGPIDSVFYCAGLPQKFFPPLDLMLVNVVGARHLIRGLLPKMPSGGAIVCVSSVAGLGWAADLPKWVELIQTPDFASAKAWCEDPAHEKLIDDGYSASKAAMIVYVMQTARELVSSGQRINAISPGTTKTPLLPKFVEIAGQEAVDAVKAVAGRAAEPSEMAGPMVYLNSPLASYVNGSNLRVDGGFSANMTLSAVTG